jgi:hypothetical protein
VLQPKSLKHVTARMPSKRLSGKGRIDRSCFAQ